MSSTTTLAIAVRPDATSLARFTGAVHLAGVFMIVAAVVRLAGLLGFAGVSFHAVLWSVAMALVSSLATAACGVFALAVARFLRYVPERGAPLPGLLLNLPMVRSIAAGTLALQLAVEALSPILNAGMIMGVRMSIPGGSMRNVWYAIVQPLTTIPGTLVALLVILGVGYAMQFAIQWRTWSVKEDSTP